VGQASASGSNVNDIERIHKVFVFLDLFRYQIGTNLFAPGRNWNEKERFYSLQEKLEQKGTFLFTPKDKIGTKKRLYLLQD
jgi:hypothetical protein